MIFAILFFDVIIVVVVKISLVRGCEFLTAIFILQVQCKNVADVDNNFIVWFIKTYERVGNRMIWKNNDEINIPIIVKFMIFYFYFSDRKIFDLILTDTTWTVWKYLLLEWLMLQRVCTAQRTWKSKICLPSLISSIANSTTSCPHKNQHFLSHWSCLHKNEQTFCKYCLQKFKIHLLQWYSLLAALLPSLTSNWSVPGCRLYRCMFGPPGAQRAITWSLRRPEFE